MDTLESYGGMISCFHKLGYVPCYYCKSKQEILVKRPREKRSGHTLIDHKKSAKTEISSFSSRFYLANFLWISTAIVVSCRAIVMHSVREMFIAPFLIAMNFYTTQSIGQLHGASKANEEACAGMRRNDQ